MGKVEVDNDGELLFAIVFLGSNILEYPFLFQLDKDKVKRKCPETDLNTVVGILPSGITASTAVCRTEGGWLCGGRQMNASAPVEHLMNFHISPLTTRVLAQSVLYKLGAHWIPTVEHCVLKGFFHYLFIYLLFFIPSYKANQVAPSHVELSLQMYYYCNLQMPFTLYAPDNSCISISW